MNILVTGGAGYIGSHVVQLLIERGYDVVVFDNLGAGYRQAVHEDATFIHGDLLNPAHVAACFETHQFDGILHFASHIQVGESMQKPFKYIKDNVFGMTNLLEQAAEHNVKRFILSSTANLYDDPQHVPISENEQLIPGSVYGETKFIGERLLQWMDRIYGMKYCALRYFNASGAHPGGHIGEAHQPETHLIPLVLQVALGQREHISIFGTDYDTPDGTCIRDYVHVCDLVDAHVLGLKWLEEGKGSAIFNLGTGDGFSVREVIDASRAVTNKDVPHTHGPRRAGDATKLVSGSVRAVRDLGWTPGRSTMRQMIEDAWNWHRTGFYEK